MAAGTTPIYTQTPHVGIGVSILTANTAMDGTGTVSTLFTAGANGSYVSRVRVKAQGTNVATVFRVFINNGSTNATATNNVLYDEVSIPATTASNTTANPVWELQMGFALPAGYVLNATIGTTVAAGVIASTIAGDY